MTCSLERYGSVRDNPIWSGPSFPPGMPLKRLPRPLSRRFAFSRFPGEFSNFLLTSSPMWGKPVLLVVSQLFQKIGRTFFRPVPAYLAVVIKTGCQISPVGNHPVDQRGSLLPGAFPKVLLHLFDGIERVYIYLKAGIPEPEQSKPSSGKQQGFVSWPGI